MKQFLFSATLLASIFFASCSNSSHENKQEEQMPSADTSKGVSAFITDSTSKEVAYICPCGGCPEVKESKPGNCPKCQMELVKEKK